MRGGAWLEKHTTGRPWPHFISNWNLSILANMHCMKRKTDHVDVCGQETLWQHPQTSDGSHWVNVATRPWRDISRFVCLTRRLGWGLRAPSKEGRPSWCRTKFKAKGVTDMLSARRMRSCSCFASRGFFVQFGLLASRG